MLEKIICMPHEIPGHVVNLITADYAKDKTYWDRMIMLAPMGNILINDVSNFIENFKDSEDKIDLNKECKFRWMQCFDTVFIFTFIDNADIKFSENKLMTKVRVLDKDHKYYTLINLNGIIQAINNNNMIALLKLFFWIFSGIYEVTPTEENSASLNSLSALIAYIEAMYCRILKDDSFFEYTPEDPAFKALIDSRYANYEPLIKDVYKAFNYDAENYSMIYYNNSALAEVGYSISQPFYDRWMLINIMNDVFTKDINIRWRKEVREIIKNDDYSDKEKFERIFVTAEITKKIVEILYDKEEKFIIKEIRQVLSEIEALTEEFPEENDPSEDEVKEKYENLKKQVEEFIPDSKINK